MKTQLGLKSILFLLIHGIYTSNINAQGNLVVSYTYALLSNGVVSFSSTSTGTTNNTTYNWAEEHSITSLGSGSTFTTTFNNGTYNIYLVASNSPGSASTSPTLAITVTSSSCNLNSQYSYVTGAFGQVQFNNTSIGTNANTIYNWDFGDGTTSNLINPSKTYTNAGQYLVTLKTYQSNSTSCRDSISKWVGSFSGSCVPNSNFYVWQTGTPLIWNAIPVFPWNVTNATWSWGDGSSSNTMYASHTYSAAGIYNICLTVTINCLNGTSTSSTCVSSTIFKSNQTTEANLIQINVIPPNQFATGIESQPKDNEKLKIFPNPCNGVLSMDINFKIESPINLKLFDLKGLEVFNIKIESKLFPKGINLNHIPNGIYLLQIEQGGQRLNTKLVISKD